jgi:hypothetical protein
MERIDFESGTMLAMCRIWRSLAQNHAHGGFRQKTMSA